jgi:Lon protease-like protein
MASYRRAADLPKLIPVFPLDGTVLLPKGQLPLNIFEPRYLNMIDDAMAGERLIGMIQTRAGGPRAHPRLCAVGCAGRITSYAETSDGRYLITLTGVSRFKVEQELSAQSPYRQVRADFETFEGDLESDAEAAVDEDAIAPLEAGRETLLHALRAYLQHRGLDIDWDQAREAPIEALINSLSMALPFEPAEKQALLEAPDTLGRREALTALLQMGAAAGGDEDNDPPMQ